MTRGNTQKIVKAQAPRNRGGKPKGHIPRPKNCFFLFRQKFNCDANGGDQQTISGSAGAAWHALPAEERSYWEEKAAEEKAAHKIKYTNWVLTRRKPGAKGVLNEAQTARGDGHDQLTDARRAVSDEPEAADSASDGGSSLNESLLPDPAFVPAPIDAPSVTPALFCPTTIDQFLPQATREPISPATYYAPSFCYNQLTNVQHGMNTQYDPYSQLYCMQS